MSKHKKSFIFEHYKQPLASNRAFLRRITICTSLAIIIIISSLFIGVLGYHHLENLSWIDSLLNASMILGGMGPVDILQTNAGKLFASFYALFSGIIFLATASLLLAPLFHRFLHRLHLEK